MATNRRLKSTSKDGQSLKSRANESRGKRRTELSKLERVDKENYKRAPLEVQNRIKAEYKNGKKKKTRTKNKGKYI